MPDGYYVYAIGKDIDDIKEIISGPFKTWHEAGASYDAHEESVGGWKNCHAIIKRWIDGKMY